MSSSTDPGKQSQEVTAEIREIATDSVVGPSQNTHETSSTQNEDAGQQHGTKTELEQVGESVEDMNPQTPWNRGAGDIEVAEILTAMRQGAFEPVRKSRVALALKDIREPMAIRNDDGVKQTSLTRDPGVDEVAGTLVAMSLSGTSEAVDAAGVGDINIRPSQPTAVITDQTQTDLGSDTESCVEAVIVYDCIDDDDKHEQPTVEFPWLPHLRRKGGKGCRDGCKACAAGIKRSEAGAGACDEDGRNITLSRP